MQPDNYQATLALGRLLIRTDKVDEAAELLEGALEHRSEDPRLLLWYAECLYKLGRYGELRKLLRQSRKNMEKEQGEEQSRIADVVRLWSGVEEARGGA